MFGSSDRQPVFHLHCWGGMALTEQEIQWKRNCIAKLRFPWVFHSFCQLFKFLKKEPRWWIEAVHSACGKHDDHSFPSPSVGLYRSSCGDEGLGPEARVSDRKCGTRSSYLFCIVRGVFGRHLIFRKIERKKGTLSWNGFENEGFLLRVKLWLLFYLTFASWIGWGIVKAPVIGYIQGVIPASCTSRILTSQFKTSL